MGKRKIAGKEIVVMLGIFLFSVLSLASQSVSASMISITTTITTNVLTKNMTTAMLELMNSGDEAAYDVQASLLLPEGFESKPVFIGQINPYEPFEGNFTITFTERINKGKYPLAVLVDYTDTNGYPFSSVSSGHIIYETPTVSRIFGSMSELSLVEKESGRLVLLLKNLDETPHDTRIKLVLPAELKVVEGQRDVSIASKNEKEMYFDVTNLAGLEGSTYAVFASIEYDDDGLHYTSFAMGSIKIMKEKSLSIVWFLVMTFILLLSIFIHYKLRGRR